MNNLWIKVMIRTPGENEEVAQLDVNNPESFKLLASLIREIIRAGHVAQIQRADN
jgi:hypothetical protein